MAKVQYLAIAPCFLDSASTCPCTLPSSGPTQTLPFGVINMQKDTCVPLAFRPADIDRAC